MFMQLFHHLGGAGWPLQYQGAAGVWQGCPTVALMTQAATCMTARPSALTQAACFIGLGIVTFWPGSYVTYIAYHSYYGRQGFAFSQIPVHDD